MSDTPETDAAFEEFRETCDLSNLENEMAAMERQRNEAREAFAIATDQLVQVQGELRQAREENMRLRENWEALVRVVNPYLREEDGSDLIPDYARITNMLERINKQHY